MIITEFYLKRKDGVKVYRRYSDKGVYIKQLLNQAIFFNYDDKNFTKQVTEAKSLSILIRNLLSKTEPLP
jgi:hypothetical protein